MSPRRRKALVVLNCQVDSLCLGGATNARGGEHLIKLINQLISSGVFDRIVWVQTAHPQDHISFSAAQRWQGKLDIEGHKIVPGGFHVVQNGDQKLQLYPTHGVEGTPGAQLAPGLVTESNDIIICKGKDPDCDSLSCFRDDAGVENELFMHLEMDYIREVVFVGTFLETYIAESLRQCALWNKGGKKITTTLALDGSKSLFDNQSALIASLKAAPYNIKVKSVLSILSTRWTTAEEKILVDNLKPLECATEKLANILPTKSEHQIYNKISKIILRNPEKLAGLLPHLSLDSVVTLEQLKAAFALEAIWQQKLEEERDLIDQYTRRCRDVVAEQAAKLCEALSNSKKLEKINAAAVKKELALMNARKHVDQDGSQKGKSRRPKPKKQEIKTHPEKVQRAPSNTTPNTRAKPNSGNIIDVDDEMVTTKSEKMETRTSARNIEKRGSQLSAQKENEKSKPKLETAARPLTTKEYQQLSKDKLLKEALRLHVLVDSERSQAEIAAKIWPAYQAAVKNKKG